jgi:hypothetical protein
MIGRPRFPIITMKNGDVVAGQVVHSGKKLAGKARRAQVGNQLKVVVAREEAEGEPPEASSGDQGEEAVKAQRGRGGPQPGAMKEVTQDPEFGGLERMSEVEQVDQCLKLRIGERKVEVRGEEGGHGHPG